MVTSQINVYQDVQCNRCRQLGATDSGLCLECITASLGANGRSDTENAGGAPVVAKLPESVKDQLIQWADSGDAQWKHVARLLAQTLEDAHAEGVRLPRMKMYQDAAAYLGQKTTTVRNWCGVYSKVGDALIGEYEGTFRFSHWRAMIGAAKKAEKQLDDFAQELAATADDYGGLPIPPDVIIARTDTAPKTDTEIFEEALQGIQLGLVAMVMHIDKTRYKRLRRATVDVVDAVEKIVTKVVRIQKEDEDAQAK